MDLFFYPFEINCFWILILNTYSMINQIYFKSAMCSLCFIFRFLLLEFSAILASNPRVSPSAQYPFFASLWSLCVHIWQPILQQSRYMITFFLLLAHDCLYVSPYYLGSDAQRDNQYREQMNYRDSPFKQLFNNNSRSFVGEYKYST